MSKKTYGHFSKDGLEYIITRPDTPRPWINYLTNDSYCAIISQCAGGYSFYKDCRAYRVLRWLPENWHFDRPGRYIYAKEKGISNLWSLTYQPTRVKPTFFQARHGLGYTVIETENHGIHSQITYFVPNNADCEIWLVKLTNKTARKRNLELYPYAEWLIGDYHEELRYRNILNLYNRVWFDKVHKAIFAKKTATWKDMGIQPFDSLAFMGSSLPVKASVTRKGAFLGQYNTEERPQMLTQDTFKNVPFCSGEDGIACFKHDVTLKAKATKEFVIVLGQTDSVPKINKFLTKFRKISQTKEELRKTKDLWKKRVVDNIHIETPDKDFNTLMNTWVKYQLYICNTWSRSPSYYHEGSGGRGYRDSCQDSESIASINPLFTRARILTLASLIRKDGTSAPGWSDTSGAAKHRPNKDHQIWLAVTVASYIKETGDKDILLEYAPYLKDNWINGWEKDSDYKGGSATDGEGTVFEHLERNLNFTFNDVGQRGLPLIGHADWNDAIDSAGIRLKGESVWLAQALVRALKVLAELAELIGQQEKKREYLHKAQTMTERINGVGWDGAWYRRGFTDNGSVYGSKSNKEGKIYLNAQSWAVLSGVAEGERLKKVIKSVDKHLDGPHGLALFHPAYSNFQPELGRISMFSEGTKENAAVFCHAAHFMVVAYCMAGCGNRAYESLKKIMPNAQPDYDLYATEPYAYAEYLVGPQHPYLYGLGAFTWITGTAGWGFMAATQWLLGVRADYNGLIVDPCIPSHWKKCFVKREFRGAVYEISIENPRGVQHGVREVVVDGKSIVGNLVEPFNDGKAHKVKVVLG
ncbi:GH36-type glycosyl hydrolase domain-containing protein [Candidatus Omnitrophota bacterium]